VARHTWGSQLSPTSDLLAALAGIAGIFVGFGALVVLSDDSAATTEELHMVRAVVSIGLITLVGALIPLGLGGFGLEDRQLWGWSSAAFLAVIWFGLLHPTNRPVLATMFRTNLRAALFFWLVLEPPIQVPLLLGVFGVFSSHASALYIVAVVLNLFQCAQTLVQVVYIRVNRAA
jgi:hypothetical protein